MKGRTKLGGVIRFLWSLVLGLGLTIGVFLAFIPHPAAKVQAINHGFTVQGDRPQIQVHFRNYDWVQGQVAPHALVDITLIDSLGRIKGSYSDWAGSDGWFGGWCVLDSNDQCVDIAPGDTVEVVYDGSAPIIVPVIEITGIVDSAADTITGQIIAENLPTQGWADTWTREDTGQDFTTDETGNYAVNFSPYDVKPGHWVNIWYTYPDGNQIGAIFSELRLDVDVGRDYVNGITDPERTATVTLRAPDGSVKGEATDIANDDGQFEVNFSEDIAPGDTVEAWAGAGHASLVVVPVTANEDDAGDKVWGSGPPNSHMNVSVNGDWRETSTDSAGDYEVQYDWDITSDNVEVQYDDPADHRIRYNFGPSDVRVNKWAPVWNVVPGDEYRYVIEYANDTNGLATDVVITDTLPDHVTYVRDTSGVTPIVDPDSRTLVWHMGTLGQRSKTFELWVKLDMAAPRDDRLRNRVEISDPGDQNPGNNWGETDVWPSDPYVDLWVNKSFDGGLPIPGEVITHRIEYGNNGNRTAYNVILTDTLPADTTFVTTTFEVGVDGQAESVGTAILAWNIGMLDPGESRQFELAAQIDSGTTPGTLLANEVVISGDNDGGEQGDNRFWVTTVVEPMAADLWVDKEMEGDLSSTQDGIIYRITYRNDGTLAAEDVALTDTLPASLTHLWHSASSVATLADGTIVWQSGTVPPGGGGQLRVGVRVSGTAPAGAVFTNTVEASTSTPELDYDGNLVVATLGPPRVICVPGPGAQPHRVWSGLATTLKGTAKGDGLTTFAWDPGDGSPAIAGTVDDPYALEARHTYRAPLGTVYTATLTVWGAFGYTDTDTYLVQIFTPTHEVKVDVAIDEALWYIHKAARRYENGGLSFAEWGDGNRVAENASAVQAFQVQGHRPGGDLWEDPYVEDTQRGWNTIFTYAKPEPVTRQPAGDPDGDGDGVGIGMYDHHGTAIYESGLAMMALATTGSPDRVARTGPPVYVRGQTYYSITQDMADWFAWGQNDEGTGTARGGWRYRPNSGDSDNSNTQFPVLGLAAAEHNWGIPVPTWVKRELRDYWLDYTQDASGGFGYMSPDDWNNVGKTGAGIMDLTWTGVPVTDTRIVRASQFIEAHWDDKPDGDWNGNLGEFYAMYAVKKGSQLADIHQYDSHIWDNEYAAYLVRVQKPDGHFDDAGNLGERPMATAWGVLILSPGLYQALPVPVIPPLLYGGEGPQWAEVQFNASDSYHTDPDREIVLYEWDFGDDSPVVTATSPITTHIYPTRGIHLATLTVWDDAGNHATAASQVNITGPGYHPPVADPGGPYSNRAGREIVLDGSGSHDADEWMGDSVVLYEWTVAGSECYTTSEPTLAYSRTISATFPVALRVQDRGVGDGPDRPQWSAPATTTVTVIQPTPTTIKPTPTAVEPTPTATLEPPPGTRGEKPILVLVGASLVIVVVVFLLMSRAIKRPRA